MTLSQVIRKTLRHGRQAALAGFRALGGLRWLSKSTWRHQRLLILCYHGVALQDEHEWDPELFVTADFLRRRFEILHDCEYMVLPLNAAVYSLRHGMLPSRSVVLTFDDGFYNFFAAAAPLLSEFSYPATVYVSSYHCIHQRPILRLTIRYLLWRASLRDIHYSEFPGLGVVTSLKNAQKREQIAEYLIDEARTFSNDREAQQAWLGEVATRLGIDWEKFLKKRLFHLMTKNEITEMARRGIDIQLHTHRHRTPREESIFRSEITENRGIIEELTGRSARHFCYPSGDCDPLFLPWLHDLQVETATTCMGGLAKAKHDPLLLPRFVDTMGQSEVQFESWLAGAAEMLSWRRS